MLVIKDPTRNLDFNLFNEGEVIQERDLIPQSLTFYPNVIYKSVLIDGKEMVCNRPIQVHTLDIINLLLNTELDKIVEIGFYHNKYTVTEFIDKVVDREELAMTKFNIQRMKEPQFEEFFLKEYWFHTNQIDFKEYNESRYEFKKQRVLYNKKQKDEIVKEVKISYSFQTINLISSISALNVKDEVDIKLLVDIYEFLSEDFTRSKRFKQMVDYTTDYLSNKYPDQIQIENINELIKNKHESYFETVKLNKSNKSKCSIKLWLFNIIDDLLVGYLSNKKEIKINKEYI